MSDKRLKVGLTVEPPGIDHPYGHGAYLGIERAVRELGVKGRVLTPAPREGYAPSLSLLARQKYDLVIATGFYAATAIDAVASSENSRSVSGSSAAPTWFTHRRRPSADRINANLPRKKQQVLVPEKKVKNIRVLEKEAAFFRN